MLLALIQVLLMLLWLLVLVIIVQAILSWLVAFNVINTRNDFVRTLPDALDRMTDAALPADPEDPARFRRHRFLAAGGAAADLGAADPDRRASSSQIAHRELGVTAAIIDGKAFAAGAARAGRRGASPPSSSADRPQAGPGRGAGRRGSGEPGLCPLQGQGDASRRAWRASSIACPNRRAEAELLALVARAQRRRRGRRHPRPAAAAAAYRRAGGDRRDRSGQGRRRLPRRQCRPARGRRGRRWCPARRSAA